MAIFVSQYFGFVGSEQPLFIEMLLTAQGHSSRLSIYTKATILNSG